MDINTKVGQYITFLGRNGYDTELQHAKDVLELGQRYRVDRIEVGNWSSTVRLVEFPECWFNTVMFANEVPETDAITN